jgi:hypothetical protein
LGIPAQWLTSYLKSACTRLTSEKKLPLKLKIQSISDPEEGFKWAMVHIVLGVVAAYFKYAFIGFFYFVILQNYKECLSEYKKGSSELFTILVSYLLGFELLNRVVQGSPFIPVEFAKYTGVFIWGYAAYIGRNSFNTLGRLMLIMAVPGILYDASDQVVTADIVNNYLPPVGLAIGVGLWGGIRPTEDVISKSMRLMWMGCVAVLACMVIRTPSYDDLSFGLAANQATTGGTSSNQASTILGLGMFLSFFSFYRNQNFSGRRAFDVMFMMAFALQGLLTFSRGGVMVGAIGIILLLLVPVGASGTNKDGKGKAGNFGKNLLFLVAGVGFLAASFLIVDKVSGGLLTLRYKGETAGTAGGYSEKSLDKVTSGRSDIFLYDMEIWLDHPILGVGAGASPYFRLEKEGRFVAPHVELSRLLAEQGLLGLCFFLLMLFLGIRIWMRRKVVPQSDLLIALYVIGLTTSFHAAMRTFVTPFFIAFSAMALSAQVKDRPEDEKEAA